MKIKSLFIFLFLSLGVFAQDTLHLPEEADSLQIEEEEMEAYVPSERLPYHPPPIPPLAVRKIEQKRWDEASGTLDYSKDTLKLPKERIQRPQNNTDSINWTSLTQGMGTFFQGLAIVLAVAAIAFGIWRMMQTPRNRLIARDGVEITTDNLDQYLHETDLERFLHEALAQGNYPLAIRLYYLQIIKDLSAKNAIHWSHEKTNRDYFREMREHRLAEQFRTATHTFERVWYGNQSLSAQDYARLEPTFKTLLSAI